MTAAAWVILALVVALAALLVVEEIRLWSARQHVAEAEARLCVVENKIRGMTRAEARDAERECLHAEPDLAPLIFHGRRSGDR